APTRFHLQADAARFRARVVVHRVSHVRAQGVLWRKQKFPCARWKNEERPMTEPTTTELTYLTEPALLELEATVLQVLGREAGSTDAILDRTVLYPQGGGQPYDTGRLEGPNGSLVVREVRFDRG